MASRILFVVYDNGSFYNVFPMGVGALAAILKQGWVVKEFCLDIVVSNFFTQYKAYFF